MLSLFAAIKSRVVPFLAALAAFAFALLYRERAARAKEELKQSERDRAIEQNATDELVKGLNRENEIRNTPIDPHRRDNFQ